MKTLEQGRLGDDVVFKGENGETLESKPMKGGGGYWVRLPVLYADRQTKITMKFPMMES